MSRQEGGQAIGGQWEEVIEETERVTIAVREKYKRKLESLGALTSNEREQRTWPKIQKVPPFQRENEKFEKYNEPKIVAIGPIHRNNTKLRYGEELKERLAGQFVKKIGLVKEKLWFDLMKKAQNLKEHYEDVIVKSYDDEDLTWMFLVDGCAVLCIIIYVAGQGSEVENLKAFASDLKIKNDQVALVQRDMFLLENQIPYQVLELLTSTISPQGKDGAGPKSLDVIIDQFIHKNMIMLRVPHDITNQSTAAGALTTEPEIKIPIKEGEHNEPGAETPKVGDAGKEKPRTLHLLHLLREMLIAEPEKKSWLKEILPCRRNRNDGGTSHPSAENKIRSFLERLRKRLPCCKNKKEDGKLFSFRSVTELQTSGIWLKPSQTGLLKDIRFDRMILGTGTLQLPPVIVDDSTGPKFLNLIAYEMCPDFENQFEVTSYVCFIDSLIDKPEDVKELRKAGILHNLLGSDEEVAKLFNEIGTDLVSHPNAYEEVKRKIGKHWQSTIMTWIAQFYHTYFSTPWSLIAFLAAVIALLFSGAQTFYTLYPKN